MAELPRIVITGVGLTSPGGDDLATFRAGLLAGKGFVRDYEIRYVGKTLAGEPTDVVYPAMPVTIKTPACPVVVSPPAPDADGDWTIAEDGNNVKAEFRDSGGNLLGFALTGDATKEKMALQKELPAILP